MATRKAAPKKAVAEKKEVEKEPTMKALIEAGISRFVEETSINNQKARYKAQRAIAFQAFKELVEAGEFDALVDRALENIAELPSGWTLDAAPTKKTKKTEKKEEKPAVEEVEEDEELEEDEPAEVEEAELVEDEPEEEPEEKPVKKPVRRRRPVRK